MRVPTADGSTWTVRRRWLRPGLTLKRWNELVRATGAGDPTAEISSEREIANDAGGLLGIALMIVTAVRWLITLLVAPFDAVLSFIGVRPWRIEAKRRGAVAAITFTYGPYGAGRPAANFSMT